MFLPLVWRCTFLDWTVLNVTFSFISNIDHCCYFHMESCPITEFFSKHSLPLHFQILMISQWMELGCWYWAQCLLFFSFFRIQPVLLNLVQQETRFDLHMQSCPIPDFLSKHPLPLHFQMIIIPHWIELGCWD